MRKYILFIVLLFIAVPNVKADPVCNNAKLSNSRDLAQNITYDYNYNDDSRRFVVNLVNIDPSFYLVNENTNETYNYAEEIVMSNLVAGTSYKIGVYTNDVYCLNQKLYTIYINLPYYNVFYNTSDCKENREFKYCKKFLKTYLTKETFEKELDKYLESLDSGVEKVEEKEKTIFDKLLEVDKRIYIGIGICVIVLIFINRYFYNKKHDLF